MRYNKCLYDIIYDWRRLGTYIYQSKHNDSFPKKNFKEATKTLKIIFDNAI